jgi:hypothetical protein
MSHAAFENPPFINSTMTTGVSSSNDHTFTDISHSNKKQNEKLNPWKKESGTCTWLMRSGGKWFAGISLLIYHIMAGVNGAACSGCNSKCDRIYLYIHGWGAAGTRRLQGFGGGTPSSRFRQHTVDAWPLQSHFELHLHAHASLRGELLLWLATEWLGRAWNGEIPI